VRGSSFFASGFPTGRNSAILRGMPSKKASRPRSLASDAAFKKRPGKSPFGIPAAQRPPTKAELARAQAQARENQRALDEAIAAGKNRAAGSQAVLERKKARAAQMDRFNRTEGFRRVARKQKTAKKAAAAAARKATIAKKKAEAAEKLAEKAEKKAAAEKKKAAAAKKKAAKKPTKKAAKKRASKRARSGKTCPPCPPCPKPRAKRGAKKGAKKGAKRGAARRAPRAQTKCVDGKIPFLFAVKVAKRCKKGTRLGNVVDEGGKSTGLEVRAVKVRCGGGNRKVSCGGVTS